MRIALAVCPYFTNGGYPPLGAAYINSTLKQAGHDVLVFDLQFYLRSSNPRLAERLCDMVNVATIPDMVGYVLDPHFTLYSIFGFDYPYHRWRESSVQSTSARKKYRSLRDELVEFCEECASTITSYSPEVVMFSTYSSNLVATLITSRCVTNATRSTVVLGGPGLALPAVQEIVLRSEIAAAIVLGDGEIAALKAIESISEGGAIKTPTPGLAILSGGVIVGNHQDRMLSLDRLNTPDFRGFPMPGFNLTSYQENWPSEFRSRVFEKFLLPLDASRSCTHRCAFCSERELYGRFRQHSPTTLVRKITRLKDEYGIHGFSFNSSLMNADWRWHEEFLDELISSELEISWWAYYRPTEDLTVKILEKMHRAGCRMVGLGIESFCQETLDNMRKRLDARFALELLLRLNATGIHTHFPILVGFPTTDSRLIRRELRDNMQALSFLASSSSHPRKWLIKGGSLVRLEPMSGLFSSQSLFGIRTHSEPVRLPETLRCIQPSVDRITLRWRSQNSWASKSRAARRLRSFIQDVLPECLS